VFGQPIEREKSKIEKEIIFRRRRRRRRG